MRTTVKLAKWRNAFGKGYDLIVRRTYCGNTRMTALSLDTRELEKLRKAVRVS